MILAIRSMTRRIITDTVGIWNRHSLLNNSPHYFASSVKLINSGANTHKDASTGQSQYQINKKKLTLTSSEVSEMIYDYPFDQTFLHSVKEYNSLDLPDDVKHSIIAWRCL